MHVSSLLHSVYNKRFKQLYIYHCSGDPLFLEPFWRQHAASSALVVAGWHRMGYSYTDHTYICQELERHVRILHSIVGNAVTAGRYIVFGAGSTQILNAAVNALSSDNSSMPTPIVASIPFYPVGIYSFILSI